MIKVDKPKKKEKKTTKYAIGTQIDDTRKNI